MPKTTLLIIAVACITCFAWAQEKDKLSIDWENELVRDPFISVVDLDKVKYEQGGLSTGMPLFPMVLRGLMMEGGRALAIINDEVVVEGQTWHDFKVESIDKGGVTLSYKGEFVHVVMEAKGNGDKVKGVFSPKESLVITGAPKK